MQTPRRKSAACSKPLIIQRRGEVETGRQARRHRPSPSRRQTLRKTLCLNREFSPWKQFILQKREGSRGWNHVVAHTRPPCL